VESQQEVLYKWLEEHKAEVEKRLLARGMGLSPRQV